MILILYYHRNGNSPSFYCSLNRITSLYFFFWFSNKIQINHFFFSRVRRYGSLEQKKARLGTDQARPRKWKSKQDLLNKIKEIFLIYLFSILIRCISFESFLYFFFFSINYRNWIADKSCIHLYNGIQKTIKKEIL